MEGLYQSNEITRSLEKYFFLYRIAWKEILVLKKILMLASRPLADDGLTKIEMDVYRKYKAEANFEFACAFGFDNKYGDELRKDKVPLYKLPPKNQVPRYMSSIQKLVSERHYDEVYIHGNSAMMAFDSIPAKKAGGRVITHCHNTKSDYPLVHHLMKPAFNRSVDVKIAVSSLAADFAYTGDHIVIIPNGIDVNRMKFDSRKRADTRKDLELKDDQVLVGHVGRFSRQKNHDKIVSVFKAYHDQNENSRLLLIGSGPEQDRIKGIIRSDGLENAVTIVDHTDQVENYLSAMDVMIIPSLFEGLCLVALEAQANGLPVIIDEKFSPETSIVRQIKVIKLNEDDKIWANAIEQSTEKGRYTPDADEMEKMDSNKMMCKIGDIILGGGCTT